jgi:hypothetical protein
MRGQISFSDLLQSMEKLQPEDESTREAIMRLLGLEMRSAEEKRPGNKGTPQCGVTV